MPSTTPSQLPAAVCSVIWSVGHPFLRDGEPGISELVVPRPWIGRDDDGELIELTDEQMGERGWTMVHDDGPAQRRR